MDDFANAIAYEVKQEIANRYFGFRTAIESEIGQYLEKLHATEREQLNAIRHDLRRMRILLHTEKLFKDFLRLVGFPQDSAPSDPPPTPAGDLFTGLKGEGICRSWRFRDLAAKLYRKLGNNVAAYRLTCTDLDEEHAGICARIDAFHRNNDLTGILEFLRTFDGKDSERLKFLHAVPSSEPGNPRNTLDQDLRIPHPRPVSSVLPPLPALPPLHEIKPSLKALLRTASSHHPPDHGLPF